MRLYDKVYFSQNIAQPVENNEYLVSHARQSALKNTPDSLETEER